MQLTLHISVVRLQLETRTAPPNAALSISAGGELNDFPAHMQHSPAREQSDGLFRGSLGLLVGGVRG